MNNPEDRYHELISVLKEKKFRLTPQRIELVRQIAASEGHPSALQFHQKVIKRFPTMSLATVYKTLALLKEVNQVLEIDLKDDNHYDGNRPEPHSHLICIRCKKIIDGEVLLDQNKMRELEKDSGFMILQPQVNLYGLCSECKDNNSTKGNRHL